MAFRTLFGSLGLAAMVVTSTATFGVMPAMAQNADCTCVIAANGTGPVGLISQASADVFLAGIDGQAPAVAGLQLFSESVVTTGAKSTATIDLGQSCAFGLGGSMKVQIVPRGEQLCVQVINQNLPPPPADGMLAAGVLAALAGGGVIVSLGLLSPASR